MTLTVNGQANVIANIYNPILGGTNSIKIFNDIKENIPTKRKRSESNTNREDFSDSEDDHDSVTDQDTSATGQDFHSSGDSDTSLQPNLPQCIFLDGPQASDPDADESNRLREKFPRLPEVSSFFNKSLEACKPLITNNKLWLVRPDLNDDEDEDEQIAIWHYVFSAIYHFALNYDVIRTRALTHGEGWVDGNVWAPLWDHAFLKSKTITIDRKDRCLGFIEVKPDRHTHQNHKGALTDRYKVIDTMIATLETHKTPGIIVAGIICNGMTFSILRGADLGLGRRQYVFKENSFVVSPEKIGSVVLCCWRTKLALEASHSALVAKLPQDVFD